MPIGGISTWRLANPNLGVSLRTDYLRRECRRAKAEPAYENVFRRLHLNQRTEQQERWLVMAEWDACAGALGQLAGRVCFAGLDLASTTDLSAFVLYFPNEDPDDPGGAVLPFYFVPRANAIERERRDRVPYLTWAREGCIELTEGNVADYTYIRRRINELSELYQITDIGVDPWNATQLSNDLDGDGFEVVQFQQGFRDMNAPTKELGKLVRGRHLRHAGHPVLRWNALNVAVDVDSGGNLRPSKKRSFERIDGLVATIIAIGRAIGRSVESGSVYDKRELVVI